jgi:hypothetical protein
MKTLPLSSILLLYVLPTHGVEVFVHMMPWFETKETNNGTWGQHWTMANRNPDNIVDGVPEIASFYHPEIGPYASSDPDVIDWQMGIMKAAGISGIFLDWPGTTDAFDYPKNKENAEAIIEGTKRNGLKFAVVYEDNNLNLASVPDKIAQGVADMEYLKSNYFAEDNYYRVKDAPLLLDFGPQALHDNEWDQVLEPLEPGTTFVSLWNQGQQAGSFVEGEFAWVWADYVDTLIVWYVFITTKKHIHRYSTTQYILSKKGTPTEMYRSRSEWPTLGSTRFTAKAVGLDPCSTLNMEWKPSPGPGRWL